MQYLAALLTSVKSNLDKAAVYLNECRLLDIPVLVPDVNESESDFCAAKFGDRRCRDRGSPARSASGCRRCATSVRASSALILAERDANGPFVDFHDFCERVDPTVLNKRTIESLVRGGAFDSLGHPRQGLLLVFEQIVDAALRRRRERDQGTMSLFDLGGDAR